MLNNDVMYKSVKASKENKMEIVNEYISLLGTLILTTIASYGGFTKYGAGVGFGVLFLALALDTWFAYQLATGQLNK